MADVLSAPQRALKQPWRGIDAIRQREPLGWAINLILVYLCLEYIRPAYPLGIPMIISIVLFLWWLKLKEKIWVPQVVYFYLLIAVIAVMGPFAVNNFSVWMGFESMFAWLACISIPMLHLADSVRKLRVLINTLIGLHCYLAVHALLHNGFGPGGFVGDENDVALAINVMIPVAFCSALNAQTTRVKVLYWAATVVLVAGVVATKSRGGFLGLVAVIGYCFFFSPRKKAGLLIGGLLCAAGFFLIPGSYWEEMGTINEAAESDIGTGAHRKRLWGVAMNMFFANPIFGVGLNNFPWNAGEYMSAELIEHEGRSYSGTAAHSVYFTILAEVGAAGSLVVAAIAYYSVKSTRAIIKKVKEMEVSQNLVAQVRPTILEVKGMAYGLGGGMIGYAVSGIFLTAFVYPHFWYVVALIVAVERVTGRIAGDARDMRPKESTKASSFVSVDGYPNGVMKQEIR